MVGARINIIWEEQLVDPLADYDVDAEMINHASPWLNALNTF